MVFSICEMCNEENKKCVMNKGEKCQKTDRIERSKRETAKMFNRKESFWIFRKQITEANGKESCKNYLKKEQKS